MKKNIEWVKEEISDIEHKIEDELYTEDTGFRMTTRLSGMIDVIQEIKKVINELDEPEVLSQEWVSDNSVFASSDGVTEEYVHVDDLQELLVPKQEEVDRAYKDGYEKGREHGFYKGYREGLGYKGGEPETVAVVIPKFVAEWIEETKPYNSLRVAFEYIAQRKRDNHDDELAFWVEEGNSETFARAWLDGFTVEEEQKYYIRDQHGVYLLAKNHREQGKVQTVAEIVEQYGIEEIELDYELTEQEIKDYDPRYMTFAKLIEEQEEI